MAPGRNFYYTDCIIFLIGQEDRKFDYPLSVASMVFEGFSQCYKLNHWHSQSILYMRVLFSMAPLDGKEEPFLIMLLILSM